MLYWAEGSKTGNAVRLTNSDARMVRFFCRFLVTALGIDPLNIRVSINVYTNNGLSIRDVEELLATPARAATHLPPQAHAEAHANVE